MPRVLALVPAAIVLLAAGIFLGGHPDRLPGFVRDPLVGDQDTRVVREAIDHVHDTYYRKIPESQLADDSVKGVVARAARSLLELLHAQGVQAVPAGFELAVLRDRARGPGPPARAADLTRLRRVAGRRARLQPGDLIVAVGKTR